MIRQQIFRSKRILAFVCIILIANFSVTNFLVNTNCHYSLGSKNFAYAVAGVDDAILIGGGIIAFLSACGVAVTYTASGGGTLNVDGVSYNVRDLVDKYGDNALKTELATGLTFSNGVFGYSQALTGLLSQFVNWVSSNYIDTPTDFSTETVTIDGHTYNKYASITGASGSAYGGLAHWNTTNGKCTLYGFTGSTFINNINAYNINNPTLRFNYDIPKYSIVFGYIDSNSNNGFYVIGSTTIDKSNLNINFNQSGVNSTYAGSASVPTANTGVTVVTGSTTADDYLNDVLGHSNVQEWGDDTNVPDPPDGGDAEDTNVTATGVIGSIVAGLLIGLGLRNAEEVGDVIPGAKDVGQEIGQTLSDIKDFITDIPNTLSDILEGIRNFLNPVLDLGQNFIMQVPQKFPFSIPWDIAAILSTFNAPAETPVMPVSIHFPGINIDWDFDIDLSDFNNIARLLRALEFVLFAVALAFVTRGVIRG